MTPEDRPTQRFEPPPWEAEAFERFQREQERARAAGELERALDVVRSPEATPAASPEVQLVDSPEDRPVAAGEETSPVPESRVMEMLAELRVEETPAEGAGRTLIYSAAAFLGTMGFFIVLAALMLFARSASTEGSATMLVAMASLVMLLTGTGCIAGAVVLYRKHHQ